jgi:ribosomal protein S27AE
MEKYGVETVETPPEKTASGDVLCPRCGNVVRPAVDTGVLLCFKCGSAPFEEASDGKP